MSKEVYVVLSASDTYVNKIMGKLSHEYYPHVSIIMGGFGAVSFSFGRKIWFFPLFAGLIEESPMDDFHRHINTQCEVYRLKVGYAQYKRIKRGLRKMLRNKNKYGYNYGGLLFLYFKRPMQLRDKFTCTQFVGYLLSQYGKVPFQKDASLMCAEDYRALCNGDCVYRGSYQKLYDSVCLNFL